MLESLLSVGVIASLVFTCFAVWMATQATRMVDFVGERKWIAYASHGWAVGFILLGVVFSDFIWWLFVVVVVAVGYLAAHSTRKDINEKERLFRFEAGISERKKSMPE